MVGVFCFSQSEWAAELHGRIHLFGDHDKAIAWMIQVLVDAGEIRMDGSDYRYGDLIYHPTDVEVMIGDFQEGLSGLEFFHVYPCECRGGVPLVDFGV